MLKTTTINLNELNQSQNYKICRSCIVCGNSTENVEEQLCEECKDTIRFVKANRTHIENLISKL